MRWKKMSKYKLDKSAQIIENPNYIMTQEEVCERLNDLEAKLAIYEKDDFEDLYYKSIEQRKDLEAKLAESEAELEKWSTQYARAYVNRQNDLIAENQELKQQLAEKDAEIEVLNVRTTAMQEDIDYWEKEFEEKEEQLHKAEEIINNPDTLIFQKQELIDNLYKIIAEKDNLLKDLTKNEKLFNSQDKISFCVEQLEKIKDKFREVYDKNRKHHLSVVKCYELVDNQIAELKKEME